MPGFALLAYAAAIEPLRAANRLAGRALYRWSHVSIDGAPVRPRTASRSGRDARSATTCARHAVRLRRRQPGRVPRRGRRFAWLRQLARRGRPASAASRAAPTSWRAPGSSPAIASPSTGSTRRRSPRSSRSSTCAGPVRDRPRPADLRRRHRAARHDARADRARARQPPRARGQRVVPADPGAARRGPQRMTLRERFGVSHAAAAAGARAHGAEIESPPRARRWPTAPASRRASSSGCSGRISADARRALSWPAARPRARRSCARPACPVLDVAVACGFVSASHFSRATAPASASRRAPSGPDARQAGRALARAAPSTGVACGQKSGMMPSIETLGEQADKRGSTHETDHDAGLACAALAGRAAGARPGHRSPRSSRRASSSSG